MQNTGTLHVAAQGEREVVMTRVFDAPRSLVYEAFQRPDLLRRWFGPRGWSLAECEVEARAGGGFRYVMQGPNGERMGMRGRYLELSAPERSVHLESFDDYPGESEVTALFTEARGRTTLTVTVAYPSRQVRDAVLAMGMEHGAAESYDKLADLLAEPAPA